MKATPLRAIRTIRAIGANLRQPPYVVPGHFYSPYTTTADVQRALEWDKVAPGVDLRAEEQLELAKRLVPAFGDTPEKRYSPNNNMFAAIDAAIYHSLLRDSPPKRVVEIGSGYSTALLLDTIDEYGLHTEVTCVEPYPDRLLGLLRDHDDVTLIRKPVQEVPPELMTSLEAGDILFIDSSHVAKAGSDVVWLFLRVLPLLEPGVLVHIHDMFWPFEYPETWLDEHRDWNEDYLVNAFLCDNSAWEIVLFASWLRETHPELIPPALRDPKPGSLWLRRVAT